MAIQACRKICERNKTSLAAHAGLMLATQLRTTADKGEGKQVLLKHAMEALKRCGPSERHPRSDSFYPAAWQRWEESTTGERFRDATLAVIQRMVVGLGAENVLEAGIRLHYTYGTPLIPGSALKGLAAHYCDTAIGARNGEFKAAGEYYRMLFGTTEGSGIIAFHDAWISPESIRKGEGLLEDVLTTHHPKYYSGKAGMAPHDGEDPTPVTFLSTRGAFRFVLEVEDESSDALRWLEYTFELLRAALRSWGAGGKTSSGYGRFGQ